MDDTIGQTMPHGALVVAIPVMVFTIISLGLSLLWFWMQHFHSERWSYVGLMALAVSGSTAASFSQQCWFVTHWRHDRTSEYYQAKKGFEHQNLAIGPLTKGASLVCFWIQMYCYNTIALLTVCWAIALVRGVYNCRHVGSVRFNTILVPTSKFLCFFLPLFLVVFPFAPFFDHRLGPALIIACAPMLCGWLVGGVCIVSIVVKYVRGLANFARIEDSRSVDISLQTTHGRGQGKSNHRISLTDKWLLLRFSFTFVCLCTFEILIINTALTRSAACAALAAQPGPDFSVPSTIGSVVMFIPGVAAGVMGFIIFATTSHFRAIYAKAFRNVFCCGRIRSKQNDGTDDVEGGLQAGGACGNGFTGHSVSTYHCRVESGGTRLEMGVVVLSAEDKELVIARAQEILEERSHVKLEQPWRTLGIDRQVDR